MRSWQTHCRLYCSSSFSKKKDHEQWFLILVLLLQLLGSPSHCPMATATPSDSLTTISDIFLVIRYLYLPLFIYLD